jgi:DNA-binding IclR family transcriptional regulator
MKRSRESKSAPVGVLSKVLKIFDLLQSHPFGLDLKTISAEAAINKSTAYRFLAHLEREGYLMRDDAGSYMLGMKLLQLGARGNHRTMLDQAAAPVMRDLWKATEETVNVGMLDGGQVLYTGVLESPHAFRLVSKIGMRRPLYSTALGKALLAFAPDEERTHLFSSLNFQAMTPRTITNLMELKRELANVRHQGYALDNEENVMGARCIGAPILNAHREAVAAISLSAPITRIGTEKIEMFAVAVKEAAAEIATRLGFHHPDSNRPLHERSPVQTVAG